MLALFAIKYAVKSIVRRPKKNLGSILAISLGVTLLIGVQVGATGIEQALADNWYTTPGNVDMTVSNLQQPMFPSNISDIISDQADLEDLELVSYRFDQSMSLYSEKNGQLLKDVMVQGVEPEDQKDFGGFYDLEGDSVEPKKLQNPNAIFVNDILADELNLKIGDNISTATPNGIGQMVPLELQVVEIIDGSLGKGIESNLDDSPIAYVDIDTFQSELIPPLQDYVTSIVYKFHGIDRSVEGLNIEEGTFEGKKKIEKNVNSTKKVLDDEGNYRVISNRVSIAENINDNIEGITSVLNLFVFILNLVGLLLIINIQAMGLDDRSYQTAVLRAMGSDRKQIFTVFMFESVIIGVFGAFLGVIFGTGYGEFIEKTIGDIFGLKSETGISFKPELIGTAMVFGIALAVVTAVVPAWFAASRSITNELRGIEPEKVEQRSNKPFVLGLATLIGGLMAAQNVAEFWTDDAWTSFEETTTILLALGMSIFGAGLLLSYINKRLGYNIAAIALYGLAIFALFDRLELIKEGNGNNWLMVTMFYLVIGSVMLVIVNFDIIMDALNWLLSLNPKMRAISQVSTKSMVAKKGRLSMVFTVLTLVLVLNIFIASSSYSISTVNVNSYDVRSHGVDIVINADVPNADIEDYVEDLDGVQEVYSFRSYFGPFYREDPADYDDERIKDYLRWRQIVEVNESVINPDGDWGEDSLPFHVFRTNEDATVDGRNYEHELGMPQEENRQLSKDLFAKFFDNAEVKYEAELHDEDGNIIETEQRSGAMVLGDYFSDFYEDLYFEDINGSTINTYSVGSMFSMMGPFEMVSGAIMVTPELFDQLPGSQRVSEPNLFLVKSTVGYFESEKANDLAGEIESVLNNLDDQDSLSSEEGVLIGASTRVVYDEVKALWDTEAAFWDFLNIFSALGLIIGAAGMVIIAVRSVAERTREIGMMRAIGFQRRTVVFTVALELIFVSLVGLVAGLLNGVLMTIALVKLLFEIPPAYPIPLLTLYVLGVTGIAILAGIVPGLRASRIPPSESLRYTG